MSFARLKAATRTLRFRLMLWNVAVVVLTAVATLLGLREGVRRALVHEMDQILSEDLEEIAISVRESETAEFTQLYEELERKARGHKQRGWFVRFLDKENQPLWSSLDAPTFSAKTTQLNILRPLAIDNFRVLQRRLSAPNSPAQAIRVGASVSLIHEDMARIDRLVMLTSGLVLLVAPLCGYWLAGRATQPLAAMIETASRLRPTQLDERLVVHNSGDELDRLAKTVNGLLDRIAHFVRQNQEFLANSAHELRSPLAAIRSSVEVALNGNRTPDEYEELLSELIEECQSLEVLVNQLLLLAETNTVGLVPQAERVELDKIVAKSAEMFRGVAESREISLLVDPLPHVSVLGSQQHLRQVVNNLLDNAIKFTGAGGTISVQMAMDDLNEQIRLQIRDNGSGIHPEDLPKVFDRFYRADKSRNRKGSRRGTGLGLSICQAIVTIHGGQISIESDSDKGTDVLVMLPKPQPNRVSE